MGKTRWMNAVRDWVRSEFLTRQRPEPEAFAP
jgi:hypothetical protein